MTGSSDSKDEVTQAFLDLAATATEDSSAEAGMRRLSDEVKIRNHAFGYADAFDSKAIDRIVNDFASDAVLTTPRGTFTGHAQIRAFYEPFTRMHRFSYHRIQSITVRVGAGSQTASFAAYFHAPFIGEAADARSQYGRYFGTLTRQDGGWKFAEWQITIDHTRAYPRSLAGP